MDTLIRRRTVIAIALTLMVTSGAWAALQLSGPDPRRIAEVQAVLWPEPQPVGDIDLLDHHGNAFGESQLRGRWSLLFFGYTHCPDVCPMTLAALSEVRDVLLRQGAGDDLQLVFVTLDPERDTVDRLGAYVGHFDATLVGVTGEPRQINTLVERLAVMNVRRESEHAGGHYHIDHTASVMLVDPQARVRGAFPPPHLPKRMARQLRTIANP